MKYHFNVPGIFIWISHIFLGAFLVYIGYMMLNKNPIRQIESLILIVIGSVGILYHLHLWYNHSFHHQHSDNNKINKNKKVFANLEKKNMRQHHL